MLVPVSVSVPAPMVRPPPTPPEMPPSTKSPENVPDALVSVRVWAPSETTPAPSSVVIEVPAVPEMSKVPLTRTSAEFEIEPAPLRFRKPAASIVVAPV